MKLKRNSWFGISLIVVAVIGLAVVNTQSGNANDARAESSSEAEHEAQPVENSMHEFMEYVFQPTYKRLKVSMAAAPTGNAGWKAIKSDSLILAEACNLLLIRKPKEHADVWTKDSIAARELGGKLYQAARKKDYKSARQNYTTMLMKCNSCHKKFADGKHQLKP